MYYKRPYCPDCKLIWSNAAIGKAFNCNKCGNPLTLKDFNPYKKSLLGLLVIALGSLTFFIKEVPLIWIGGVLWGVSIIAYAFKNWLKVNALDKIKTKKTHYSFIDSIKAVLKINKFIIVNCPSCGQKLRAPKIKKNLRIRCPSCKTIIVI